MAALRQLNFPYDKKKTLHGFFLAFIEHFGCFEFSFEDFRKATKKITNLDQILELLIEILSLT